MKYVLNCRKLVDHFGGAKALVGYHGAVREKFGYERLPESTVRSWVRNNGISTDRLLEIKTISWAIGKTFVFGDFCTIEMPKKGGK